MTVVNGPQDRSLSNLVDLAPAREPAPIGTYETLPISSGTLELMSGYSALSVSSCGGSTIPDTESRVQLQLDPECPVVIGRQDHGIPPYLDPAYQSTRLVPGTGQPVVQSSSEGKDRSVSRAHFMLRGCSHGILLTNGVPRAGGGIRPPTNGTWMHEPQWRLMEPEEEFLIEHGTAVVLQLPNNNILRICAA
jgi:hypothetical protein